MAYMIEFTATAEVNGDEYKRGDTLSVSDSLFEKLTKGEKPVAKAKKASKSKED